MVVFYVLEALIAAYGGLYLASAIFAPAFFVRNLAFEDRARGGFATALFYLRMAAVTFGIGFLLYHATEALVDFVPRGSGDVDEDGVWRSTREGFQGFVAFWGAIACTLRANEIGGKLAAHPYERAARRALIEVLGRSYLPEKLSNAVMESFEHEMLSGGMGRLSPNRHSAELCRSLRNSLRLERKDYALYERD